MNARIRRSPEAQADLDAIFTYIARFDAEAAERMIARIVDAIETLRLAPLTGTLRPDIAPDARSKPVGKYLILFHSTGEQVTIVRVMHGARDPRDMRSAFD